ncbi:MAG: OmpA family protein [Alphaproteobacteria bacterium]|nr:OmpA family protein [Alphaproteobacteria bacterium]
MFECASLRPAKRRSPAGTLLAVAFTGLFLISAGAIAQTTVYTDMYGNPNVVVDLSVLERLGPRMNLPALLRQHAPTPSAPLTSRSLGRSGLAGGLRGGLKTPPAHMPQSQVTLPPGGMKLKPRAARAAVAPPTVMRPAAPPKSPSVAPPKRPRVAAKPKAPPLPPKVAKPKRPRVAVRPPAPPKVAVKPPSRVAAPRQVKPPAPRVKAPSAVRSPPSRPSVTVPMPPAPPSKAARVRAPQVAALTPTVAPKISSDGNHILIGFASGSSELPESAKGPLAELAQRMKKEENLRVQLKGYAAGNGKSPSQARRMALFRALTVRTHLMKQGVRSTRMDVRALGNKVDGGPPERVDVVVQQ